MYVTFNQASDYFEIKLYESDEDLGSWKEHISDVFYEDLVATIDRHVKKDVSDELYHTDQPAEHGIDVIIFVDKPGTDDISNDDDLED